MAGIAFIRQRRSWVHGTPLPALALILSSFFEFVILAGLGLWYRSRSDVHKRLMLLASVTVMEAGVIRLPIALLDHGFPKTHVATEILLLVIIAIDSFKHRRVHPAFLWAMLFLVSMQIGSGWLSTTSGWRQIAQQMIRTGNPSPQRP